MSKLVLLSEEFAGRTYELSVEKTTVGRVDDNAFQISEPSVSSHHAEIILRGNDVVIKDLNSTNGTFINGDKITEAVLKPGQVLRFGSVELKLDGPGGPAPATAAGSKPGSTAAASAAAAKKTDSGQTRVIQRGGVKLNELQEGATTSTPKFQTTAFAKKSNKTTIVFISIAIVLVLAIVIFLVIALTSVKGAAQ